MAGHADSRQGIGRALASVGGTNEASDGRTASHPGFAYSGPRSSYPGRVTESGARWIAVHDRLRYARGSDTQSVELEGFLNYHYLMSPATLGYPKVMLEAGINHPAEVRSGSESRRPLIAIRSSPWKAGHETNPWHDEFDLDHGHVRYFGDHKVDTGGIPGATVGNRTLLEAWALHSGTNRGERLLAPPLLLFRSFTVSVDGRSTPKGHVEFCGAALIERLEHVVQRDSKTGRSFPNLALDLAVVAADDGDRVDLRWIDDRRDSRLSSQDALRHAPESWRRWVQEGRSAIPRVRRRVLSSRAKSTEDQTPSPGSAESDVLDRIYRFFDGRKHSFELLAARVAGEVLRGSGAQYHAGWLTRSGGDGGVDFVGRLDIGATTASTPLVVLGQAKCVKPSTSISPDQVARVVARLRRGWVGVFVTTGVFSAQAQAEVVDDQYPLVLVPGRVLAEQVLRMAASDFGGDLDALLASVLGGYEDAITQRRPEEILFA